ncbi:MAG: hypothetical protein SFY32_15260 [Bacteroidota bacterium]|nr:hypothetical protein [Bacteroidota bacterium]
MKNKGKNIFENKNTAAGLSLNRKISATEIIVCVPNIGNVEINMPEETAIANKFVSAPWVRKERITFL